MRGNFIAAATPTTTTCGDAVLLYPRQPLSEMGPISGPTPTFIAKTLERCHGFVA
jgi:hypothetical protein